MDEILNIVVNNGVAIGVLCYFIYRDNKYINYLMTAIEELKHDINEIRKNTEDKGVY